jgi:hypothetical protein
MAQPRVVQADCRLGRRNSWPVTRLFCMLASFNTYMTCYLLLSQREWRLRWLSSGCITVYAAGRLSSSARGGHEWVETMVISANNIGVEHALVVGQNTPVRVVVADFRDDAPRFRRSCRQHRYYHMGLSHDYHFKTHHRVSRHRPKAL